MAEPYMGEIRLFGFGYTPRGWAACDGSLLAINAFQALYSLIGTTYGGDGRVTFALPDLRGRVPAHRSQQLPLGTRVGSELEGVTINQVPAHGHEAHGTSTGASGSNPAGALLAGSGASLYARQPEGATLVPLNASTIAPQGGGRPHENRQPFLAMSFCIAIEGIYPPTP